MQSRVCDVFFYFVYSFQVCLLYLTCCFTFINTCSKTTCLNLRSVFRPNSFDHSVSTIRDRFFFFCALIKYIILIIIKNVFIGLFQVKAILIIMIPVWRAVNYCHSVHNSWFSIYQFAFKCRV